MNIAPNPIEWLPLAQAALTLKLMPRRWKMVLRFMFTVEFMLWNIQPLPSSAESRFSIIRVWLSTTAFADESLPINTPTSFFSR